MKEKKITTIYQGTGDMYATFTTDPNKKMYDEIKEESKFIGKGLYNDLTVLVYRCYKDGKLKCEIEANAALTIHYDQKFRTMPF